MSYPLIKGNTFATGNQVSASTLNSLVDLATFDSDVVDGVSLQVSSDQLSVKDGGITPAKLSTGAPTWDSNGRVLGKNLALELARNDTGSEGGQLGLCRASDNTTHWQIDCYGSSSTPALRFFNPSGERASIDDSGNMTLAGTIRVASSPPASASATGTQGTITWDSSYIYVCIATNTWKRVAIASW